MSLIHEHGPWIPTARGMSTSAMTAPSFLPHMVTAPTSRDSAHECPAHDSSAQRQGQGYMYGGLTWHAPSR